MSDKCRCGHTSAWHIGRLAGGRFTQTRECAVEGCPCQDFKSKDAA